MKVWVLWGSLALCAACVSSPSSSPSSPPSPSSPVYAIDYRATADESRLATAACASGAFRPTVNEPPEYRACSADAECAKVLIPGCCSELVVSLHRQRMCVVDLGSGCDVVCDEATAPFRLQQGAESLRPACIDGTCSLIRGDR